MKVRTVYDVLNQITPFEYQEEWDNSGLIVGDYLQDVKKIYISLDIDDEVIEKIENDSLLILHHPLIFKGLKRVIPNTFSSKYLISLIKKNVSLIAAHTNFDKTHLNNYFATQVLGLSGIAEDFIFYSDVFMKFEELAGLVKNKTGIEVLRVVKAGDFIERVAITTGAGMSLLGSVKADCFLTGDIKYHEAMEAKARGISLMDIGHYESEKHFVDVMYKALKPEIGEDIEIVKLNSQNPFNLI